MKVPASKPRVRLLELLHLQIAQNLNASLDFLALNQLKALPVNDLMVLRYGIALA